MRQRYWLNGLAAGVLLLALAACDPSTIYSSRSRVAAPPTAEGATEPTPAPGSAPAAAPLPPADPDQRLRTLEEQVQRLERRLAEMDQRSGVSPAVPAKAGAAKRVEKTTAPAAKATPAPPATPPGAGEKVYTEGLRLYQKKNYKASREKLSQYLKAQPQGPKAAEARYYLGDSFYQEKKFQEAKEEFNKLVTHHPKSILAPTALLRQAYAYQQLNQNQNYQASLKKLMSKYPRSPEAQEAQRLLKPGGTPR